MDLTLNSEEQQVVDAAAAVLRKSLPCSRLHRQDADVLSPVVRSLLADQGWFGLAVDSAHGGFDLSAVEQMLVFREIGRGLGPMACLHIALASQVASLAGNSALTARLVAGEVAVALAVSSLPGETGGTGPVSGSVRAIDVRDASLMLIATTSSACLVDLTNAGVSARPCLDKSVSMAMVELKEASIVARTDDPVIHRTGELLTAAMLVGVAEAARDMIVEYAKVRQTFGRPIGAYQAVRHPCADMAVRCEVARCQLFVAAVSLRDARSDVDLQIDSAKLLANAAAIHNVDWNTQLHGGIAVMDEHDAHLYLKHAHLLSRCFGSDKSLLDRIIDAPIQA